MRASDELGRHFASPTFAASVDCAALFTPACSGCSCVGVTAGFSELMGYDSKDVLGLGHEFLFRGVPSIALSKSMRKNFESFCETCRRQDIHALAEMTEGLPCSRKDGTFFVNFIMYSLVTFRGLPVLVAVMGHIGEGIFASLSSKQKLSVTEKHRLALRRLSRDLQQVGAGERIADFTAEFQKVADREDTKAPANFAFYAGRLQEHTILCQNGRTAERREASQLASGCLVFGDRALRQTPEGLSYTVRVDAVVTGFRGYPLLGFTTRRPEDRADLYPSVSRCCGSSILIGGSGEAFARSQIGHLELGFQKPSAQDIQAWSLEAGTALEPLRPDTLLTVHYAASGYLRLLKDGEELFGFDLCKPIDVSADYFAVVDVCHSVASMTIVRDELPAMSPIVPISKVSTSDTLLSELDIDEIPNVLDESDIVSCLGAAVASCEFLVAVADPRCDGCPLIAVSEEVLRATRRSREELIGKSLSLVCREDFGATARPAEVVAMRLSDDVVESDEGPCRTLLEMRELVVAHDPKSGRELRFIVGVQSDAIDRGPKEAQEDVLQKLQFVADRFSASIWRAICADIDLPGEDERQTAWTLLNPPSWRELKAWPSSTTLATTPADDGVDKDGGSYTPFVRTAKTGSHSLRQHMLLPSVIALMASLCVLAARSRR